jgi:DNA-directed RNA polymerase II subunit RPB1
MDQQQQLDDITQLPPLGKPLYIQSFLPTSQHIRSKSVLTIESPDDLNSNKLGVSAWEDSCLTCDNFLEDCPGHDGIIELPIPIYRIFFVKRLIQVLNCICFYCQRLRLPKADKRYEWIASLELEYRLEYLEKYSKPYKYCGQQPKETEPDLGIQQIQQMKSKDIQCPCHKMFVRFCNEDRDSTFIRAIIRLDDADHMAYRANNQWKPISIGPQDIFDCINNLDAETKFMLGCNEWNDPSALMWDVLNVPSLNTRPCHTFSGIGAGKKRVFNDWTKFLRNIVMARNDLRDIMKLSTEKVTCCHYIYNDIESKNFTVCFRYGYLDKKARDAVKARLKPELKKANYGAVETAWRNLNKHTAAFHSHRHKKFVQKGSYGKPLVNVEERYKYQKYGRFRGNVIARRVDNSGRGVLEGDIRIGVDEVCIPRQEAMNLSVKTYVNSMNLRNVQMWILNGPYTYPGANYVMTKEGKEINLAFYENRRDIDPTHVLFVRRHLMDGDLVLVGRQPTLHRPSMMTFRCRIIDGYAIRLHYAVFTPLGADCDGDEVNFQVPQMIEAVAEASEISAVKFNIMKDGKILIKFIQNSVIAAYLITQDNVLLNQDDVAYITSNLELFGYPTPHSFQHGEPRWTGHQIVSLLFPRDFNLVNKKAGILIENGQLVQGQLNDNILNGNNGILHHLYRDYADKQITLTFLHQAYILFQNYLDLFGHSAGYYDCAVDYHDEDAVKEGTASLQMVEMLRKMDQVQDHIQNMNKYVDQLPSCIPDAGDALTENNIRDHIDKVTHMSLEASMAYHEYVNKRNNNDNGILHMIKSGAKGSKSTINQMCGIVGQIYVMYRRYPFTSSHFIDRKNSLEAYGFIKQSYSRGIPLPAIVAEAHATCESVVNKNKGTSKSGYTIRKLTTCMMGVVIDYLNRAVDTNNRVIWSIYGNDGYDPQCMTQCPIRILDIAERELVRKYGTMIDFIPILKKHNYHYWLKLMTRRNIHQSVEWQKICTENENCDNLDQPEEDDHQWFQTLQHVVAEGYELFDQTYNWESHMSPEVLYEWKTIKYHENTYKILAEEVVELMDLRKKVRMLLARCNDIHDMASTRAPFSFNHLFDRCKNIVGSQKATLDLHPLGYRQFTQRLWQKLIEEKLVIATNLTFKCLFLDWFSTRNLMDWQFGLDHLYWITREMRALLVRALIQPGESVGVNATQNMGEPFAQLTLKSPHFSGKFTSVVAGTVRIANIIDSNFCNTQMTIVLKPYIKTRVEANIFGLSLTRCYLRDILENYPTYSFRGEDMDRVCCIHIPIHKRKTIQRLISLRSVVKTICNVSSMPLDLFQVSYMDSPDDWYIRLNIPLKMAFWKMVAQGLDKKKTKEHIIADNIIYNLCHSVVIHGLSAIENFVAEEMTFNTATGTEKRWVISTLGSDLRYIFRLPEVDTSRTISNDVTEMCSVLGMHAARKSLENEFLLVMSGMMDTRHVKLVSRMMASDLIIKGMKIKQVAQNIPPLQRAAYEQTTKQMLEYCAVSEKDDGQTICGAVLMNKLMNVGTCYNNEMKVLPDYKIPDTIQSKWENIPHHINQYVFSPKADGIRYFLVFFHNRQKEKIVALVDRNYHCFLFSSENIEEDFFNGTIIDGELIHHNNIYTFLAFDCLMSCGNKSAVLRYDQRIEITREVLYRITSRAPYSEQMFNMGLQEPYALPVALRPEMSQYLWNIGKLPFTVIVKPLFDLSGLAHYEKTWMHNLPFQTDGFVFTHLFDPAYPFRTKPLSVLKWKPRTQVYNENTIDFMITVSNDSQTFLPLKKVFSLNMRSKNKWTSDLQMHEVEKYRTTKPLQSHDSQYYYLWTVLPDKTLFCFSAAYLTLSPEATFQASKIYECRWNYELKTWEIVRFRNKEMNQWTTVLGTIQNIIEDIQIEELCV